MISRAHAGSSAGVAGRQLITRSQAAVRVTPVISYGPPMVMSRRCGTPVIPYEYPIFLSASDHSWGDVRSSTGPSVTLRNAADTRCGPAVTGSGSVTTSTPPGSCRCIHRSRGISATRAPSIETSISSSNGAVWPKKFPVDSCWKASRK